MNRLTSFTSSLNKLQKFVKFAEHMMLQFTSFKLMGETRPLSCANRLESIIKNEPIFVALKNQNGK
jgi:hypothetical protein